MARQVAALGQIQTNTTVTYSLAAPDGRRQGSYLTLGEALEDLRFPFVSVVQQSVTTTTTTAEQVAYTGDTEPPLDLPAEIDPEQLRVGQTLTVEYVYSKALSRRWDRAEVVGIEDQRVVVITREDRLSRLHLSDQAKYDVVLTLIAHPET